MCAGVACAQASDLGQCPGTDKVETELKNSTSSGYYIPGLKLIVMNMTVLEAYAPSVRKFIFAHECAHADPAIADDEVAADCAAASKGAADGWLEKPDVIKVCAHLSRYPADATHPPIAVRCSNIRRCSGLFDRTSSPEERSAETPASGKGLRDPESGEPTVLATQVE